MNCTICQSEKTKKHGTNRHGNQRFRCLDCKKTFQQEREKPLGEMTLPIEKAIAVLRCLVEGCSIRSTERLTGVNRGTILSLLETVGEKCIRLFDELVQGIRVSDVQCDEIWGFVGMKQKTANKQGLGDDATLGDAWCFVAIEQHTKLILAYHLGRRTSTDTEIFTEKLERATVGNFQVNTDGFAAYKDAISLSLGTRVDFAQIIKVYGKAEGEEHRYSPAQVTEIKKNAVIGNPDLEGDGVYFFESSMWNAQWWARNFHSNEPCVLQAEIDLGKCFDLNNGAHHKYLSDLYGRVQMEKRLRGKSSGSFDFKITDAALIELLARECKIDTVRALQTKAGTGQLFNGSRFLQYQDLVICVRNTACILKYEIVEGG